MAGHAEHIRRLNDGLRRTFQGGRVVQTSGVASLGTELMTRVHQQVQAFDAFSQDNDPHGEHDFGSFEIEGLRVMWKIDYYDPTMTGGSENPADPSKTTRVLTIMLAEEY